MVPRREVGDLGADRLDDARRLVAEHDRRRGGKHAVGEAQVRVAHAAVPHADAHLARSRVGDGDVVTDDQWRTRLLEDRGSHRVAG